MRSLVSCVVALIGAAALGALLGLLWDAWAPRVELVVASDGVAYPSGFQPEGYATDDGIAALLCIAAGLVVGAVVLWAASRTQPRDRVLVVSLVTVTVLGAVGALTLWRVGQMQGSFDLAAAVGSSDEGTVITAPLRLRMPGVLVLWPAASVLVVFIAALIDWMRARRPVSALSPRDGGNGR